MVPTVGIEPTVEQILSLLCLPIPPRGHKNGTATENRTPINEMKTRCTNRYTIAAENVQVIDGLAHMLYRLVIRYGHLNKALKWSRLSDLNRRPPVYKTGALPLS